MSGFIPAHGGYEDLLSSAKLAFCTTVRSASVNAFSINATAPWTRWCRPRGQENKTSSKAVWPVLLPKKRRSNWSM